MSGSHSFLACVSEYLEGRHSPPPPSLWKCLAASHSVTLESSEVQEGKMWQSSRRGFWLERPASDHGRLSGRRTEPGTPSGTMAERHRPGRPGFMWHATPLGTDLIPVQRRTQAQGFFLPTPLPLPPAVCKDRVSYILIGTQETAPLRALVFLLDNYQRFKFI